jgi:hypothetical protein
VIRRRARIADEELVARLRATLRQEADAVVPFGERVRAIAAIETHRSRTGARRRRVALGAAAAAAAAVIGAAVSLPNGGSGSATSSVGVTSRAPASHTRGDHRPGRGGAGASNANLGHGWVGYLPPDARLPSGFVPLSVTFVPVDVGWVLGTVRCGSGRCLALAHTTDAGATWVDLGSPRVPGEPLRLPASAGAATRLDLGVRFAAGGHGWIYGDVDGRAILWATDDGGQTWAAQSLPDVGTGIAIDALETNDGLVQVVVSSAAPAAVRLLTWNILSGSWSVSGTTLPAAADGAVQLVLQQTSAWVLDDAGGRLLGAASYDLTTQSWHRWGITPCGGGAAQVASAVASDVLAVCDPGSGSASFVSSADGGDSFRAVEALPAGLVSQEIAAAGGTTVVVGGRQAGQGVIELGSVGSDGWGRAWSSPTFTDVRQLGFESTDQGVAIVDSGSGAEMLMTRDAGTSWAPVNFGV